ncbi:MAG: DUF2461 domain-containing protein [bacterium]
MKKSPIILDAPPPEMEFEGFSKRTFHFLHGLKKNNNKEWFEAHRNTYDDDLREPSKHLVGAMSKLLFDEDLPLTADPKKSLFRINRDIRFSKDKSPYKTHIGIVFPMKGMKEDEWTGMYLGFEPEGKNDMKVYVGGGCYMPSAPFLKRIRKKIDTEYIQLEKLVADKSFRKIYPEGITDETGSLKRMPKGYDEGHPASRWLKMKSYTFGTTLTKEDLMSKKLPSIIIAKIKAAMPVMMYFAQS